MPRKRTYTLQAAIRAGKWELVAKYSSQHGRLRGRKSSVILAGLKTFVLEMALPGEAMFEVILDYLGIDPLSLIPQVKHQN